ncbi:hypothetical protein B0J14DRAFT_685967 [Halenospora varia]|nr:hypothetical protein B0J14DRAFT_685967 [Halenospora varia]
MPSVVDTHGCRDVIIVGAGPAGLLLALLLSKKGISTRVLDAAEKLDSQPRATHYGPPAVHELARAGVLEDVRAEGFIAREVCWRKLSGEYIAGLDGGVLDGYPDQLTCLPLDRLGKILYSHLQAQSGVDVLWQHKVTSIHQSEEKAYVEVETAAGTKMLEADYVVGCDGANSQIRRALFGDWNFPGRTWDEQIVATNTYYPFEKYGYVDANFIIDKEHWHMASRITNDGLWRVTYGEVPGLTRDEILSRQPKKFEQILPGYSGPDCYKLANISPYKVHQRLAEKLRVGRFLLAADAAHLCNPFGGLGLTGGIADVGGLYDCLAGIYDGMADDSILDKYSEIRREKYLTIVDPISSENLRRMFIDPETALESDEFLQLCKKCETDVEFSKQVQLGVNSLTYDFTQEYKTAKAVVP